MEKGLSELGVVLKEYAYHIGMFITKCITWIIMMLSIPIVITFFSFAPPKYLMFLFDSFSDPEDYLCR